MDDKEFKYRDDTREMEQVGPTADRTEALKSALEQAIRTIEYISTLDLLEFTQTFKDKWLPQWKAALEAKPNRRAVETDAVAWQVILPSGATHSVHSRPESAKRFAVWGSTRLEIIPLYPSTSDPVDKNSSTTNPPLIRVDDDWLKAVAHALAKRLPLHQDDIAETLRRHPELIPHRRALVPEEIDHYLLWDEMVEESYGPGSSATATAIGYALINRLKSLGYLKAVAEPAPPTDPHTDWRGNLESFVAAVFQRAPEIVRSIRAECFDDSDWARAIDAVIVRASDESLP